MSRIRGSRIAGLVVDGLPFGSQLPYLKSFGGSHAIGAGKSTGESQYSVNYVHESSKTISVTAYRRQIGYVGQEPVLFATTVRDNILMGCKGSTDSD